MLKFKQYLLYEATKQELWTKALGPKPEKYGAGFADLVKDEKPIELLDGSGSVILDNSNTDLLDVFRKALSKDDLVDNLVAADEGEKVLKWTTTKSGKKQKPRWKVKSSELNIDYVPLNRLKKDSVNPSSTPTGGEWESMISIGYNMYRLGEFSKDGKPLGPNEKSAQKDNGYGIPFKEYQTLKKDFWNKWGTPAIKVGKAFYDLSELNKEKMTQNGKGTGTLTGPWKGWHTGGKKNTTPKTDMYVGKGGIGQRISLKKSPGGQVMSGALGESIATFQAALSWMGDEDNAAVGKMIEDMKAGYKKIQMEGSITDLKAGTGFAATMNPKKRKKLLAKLAAQDKVHGDLSELMNTLFNNNPDLKRWFVYEAATGGKKFGEDDISTADFVVEFDETKEAKGAIQKFKDLRNPKTSKGLTDLVNETEFYCSFKTGKKDPYTSTRTKTIKLEEYIPTLRHLIIDHIESNESTRMFLPENYEQLDEFALLNRAIQGMKRGATRLKTKAKDTWMSFTDKVKKFLADLFKKVDAALDKIKKLAGKALQALIEFFGFEVDSVKSSGPAIIFHKMV
tara:strand:+ start:40 stop:1737 length:1698 start_codon:yes stop_codon:yes gene_type:complete